MVVLHYQKTTRMEGDKESTTELGPGFGLFQLRSQLSILTPEPSKSHGKNAGTRKLLGHEGQSAFLGGDKDITETLDFQLHSVAFPALAHTVPGRVLPRLISLSVIFSFP